MIEEIISNPKKIRIWTIFKNTNHTIEGIEALSFAMRQPALDEIEKEGISTIFMSENTAKLMKSEVQRLKQENEELKKDLKAETEQAQKWYQRETDKHFIAIKYKQALEEIRKYCEEQNLKADYTACEVLTIIDEALND